MSQKYDRQLRLWSSSGQELISSSRVLVLGTSLTQCEALKNLILAGIGYFNLVGVDREVNVNDIEGNFYLDDEDLGQPLLLALGNRLNELNSDTKHGITKFPSNLENFLNEVVQEYDLIISDRLIDFKVGNGDVPVLEIQSRSYYSLVNLKYEEINIVDTHRSVVPDLKLLKSWPELRSFFDSFDLRNSNIDELSNVPYPVILYQLVKEWYDKEGKLPESRELTQFKKYIRAMSPKEELLNLEEAVRNAHMITAKSKTEDLEESLTKDLHLIKDRFQLFEGSYNEKFWILVFVLNEYLSTYGQFPVLGELPDMDSDTNNYLALKKIYKDKFNADLEDFKRILHAVYVEFHIKFQIEEEMIVKFVKNCRVLHHSKSKSKSPRLAINHPLDSKFKTIAYIFTLLRDFPLPASLDNYQFALDNSKYSNDERFQNILYEFLRAEDVELLNIASVTGGVAAQEALKLLMKQYVPLLETWVFDGVSCESEKF